MTSPAPSPTPRSCSSPRRSASCSAPSTQALAGACTDCVVTDVGSTKRVRRRRDRRRAVRRRPPARGRRDRRRRARARGPVRRRDLVPDARRGSTAGVLYERLHRLLSRFGARPTAIDAETHDRLMAGVSHLPHVLANLLVAAGRRAAGRASPSACPRSGRASATRPASPAPTRAIWTDIYMSNRDALMAEPSTGWPGSAGGARLARRGRRGRGRAPGTSARAPSASALLGAGLVGGAAPRRSSCAPRCPTARG